MSILDINQRMRTAAYGLPKAWVVFGLAGALWALLYALGVEGMQLLHHIRF